MTLISPVDILSGISVSLPRLRVNTLMNFLHHVPCSQAWSAAFFGFYLRFQSQGVLMTCWALCCENCFGAGLGTTASRNTDETAFPFCPHPSYFYKFILLEQLSKRYENKADQLGLGRAKWHVKAKTLLFLVPGHGSAYTPVYPLVDCENKEIPLRVSLQSAARNTWATYFQRGALLADSLESTFRLSTWLSSLLGYKLPTGSLIQSPQQWTIWLAPSFLLT